MRIFLIISVSNASEGAFHSWTPPPPTTTTSLLLSAKHFITCSENTGQHTHFIHKVPLVPERGLSLHSEPPNQGARCFHWCNWLSAVWFGHMRGTNHFSNRLLTYNPHGPKHLMHFLFKDYTTANNTFWCWHCFSKREYDLRKAFMSMPIWILLNNVFGGIHLLLQ